MKKVINQVHSHQEQPKHTEYERHDASVKLLSKNLFKYHNMKFNSNSKNENGLKCK